MQILRIAMSNLEELEVGIVEMDRQYNSTVEKGVALVCEVHALEQQ